MKRYFEEELQVLRSHLAQMGQKAAENLRLAVRAFEEGDTEVAARVRSEDDELDRLEMEIDAEAIRYMSLRGPVGRDLRLLIIAIKAGGDLERIGDEATNIAKRAQKIHGLAGTDVRNEELRMISQAVQEMLRDALDALLHGDVDKALEVCERDEEVDRLNKSIFRKLSQLMSDQPERIPVALQLILLSKSLERIGDHATNLAEEVVFLFRAEDIRHQHSQ